LKVSIIIPCYNGEVFLPDSIQSVLAQSHGDIECIVIDDCSTDGSRDTILAFAQQDARVVPVMLEHNSGPSVARNAGIAVATGEWLTFLDADDRYARDRIERLLAVTETQACDMVIDNQSVRNYPDDTHLFSGFSFLPHGKLTRLTPELFFQEDAKSDASLRPGYMKAMIRTAWLREQNTLFDPNVRVGEDFLLYANLLAAGGICLGLGYDGYIYRRRPTSISRSAFANLRQMAAMNDGFLDRNLGRLSPASQKSLRRKSDYLRRFAALGEFRIELSRGRLVSALRLVLRSPAIALAAAEASRRRFQRIT
jgi:glycosyltransferase involved in cell wall biosynthesis